MKKIGFYRNVNTLFVQNLNVIEIIKKFGSPLYLYDSTLIKKSYKKLSKIIAHLAVSKDFPEGVVTVKYMEDVEDQEPINYCIDHFITNADPAPCHLIDLAVESPMQVSVSYEQPVFEK